MQCLYYGTKKAAVGRLSYLLSAWLRIHFILLKIKCVLFVVCLERYRVAKRPYVPGIAKAQDGIENDAEQYQPDGKAFIFAKAL